MLRQFPATFPNALLGVTCKATMAQQLSQGYRRQVDAFPDLRGERR